MVKLLLLSSFMTFQMIHMYAFAVRHIRMCSKKIRRKSNARHRIHLAVADNRRIAERDRNPKSDDNIGWTKIYAINAVNAAISYKLPHLFVTHFSFMETKMHPHVLIERPTIWVSRTLGKMPPLSISNLYIVFIYSFISFFLFLSQCISCLPSYARNCVYSFVCTQITCHGVIWMGRHNHKSVQFAHLYLFY